MHDSLACTRMDQCTLFYRSCANYEASDIDEEWFCNSCSDTQISQKKICSETEQHLSESTSGGADLFQSPSTCHPVTCEAKSCGANTEQGTPHNSHCPFHGW